MLILVGVTINFAINGGIITKSKQAAKQMQQAADMEELQLAVISAMDYTTGQVVRDDLVASLSNGWSVTSTAPYTCTSPSGNVFTVTADGQITAEGESSGGNIANEDLAYLREYIGQSFADICDFSGFIFTDSNIVIHEEFDPESPNMDATGGIIVPIRYKGNIYSFIVDESGLTITNVVTGIASPGSGSGSGSGSYSDDSSSDSPESSLQYVRLNNIDYIVFDEDTINGTVDLISSDALGSVTLGDNNKDFSAAATSYNDMVNTLVTACKDATGLTVDGTNIISVRSVGNTNVKYTNSGISGLDNPGTYTYDYQTAGAGSDWFTTNGYDSYNLKAEDNNYESDYNTMDTLGISQAGNSASYWLASRRIHAVSSDVYFNVRVVGDIGNLGSDNVCYVGSYGSTYGYGSSYAVRPVVTLDSMLLSSASGSGTSADPYVIQ